MWGEVARHCPDLAGTYPRWAPLRKRGSVTTRGVEEVCSRLWFWAPMPGVWAQS